MKYNSVNFTLKGKNLLINYNFDRLKMQMRRNKYKMKIVLSLQMSEKTQRQSEPDGKTTVLITFEYKSEKTFFRLYLL